jgi:uncharacterized protein (TIGR03000 family)
VFQEEASMYSVVLMMAMTTGAETPDCGRRHGCNGGCNGGCYGGGCYGGGCYGGRGGWGGGCTGCAGVYGYPGGIRVMPGAETKPPLKEKPKEEKPKKEEDVAAPAKLIINLPAGSRLLIDGVPTEVRDGTTRTFETPELQPGQDYTYRLTALVPRGGRTNLVVEQRVAVRSGKAITVDLLPPGGVAR